MEKHGRNEGRLGQGQSLVLLVVLVSLRFSTSSVCRLCCTIWTPGIGCLFGGGIRWITKIFEKRVGPRGWTQGGTFPSPGDTAGKGGSYSPKPLVGSPLCGIKVSWNCPILIFRPNWGLKGREKPFWDRPPTPPLITGFRWPGPPLIHVIWRSGSAIIMD